MSKIGLANCSLHVYHRPEPLTGEDHHVEPQAWQLFKATGDAENARQLEKHMMPAQVMLSADYRPQMAGALYNKRTVRLAPTCHRNVHFWIVRIMRAFEQVAYVNDPDVRDASMLMTAVETAQGGHARGQEFYVATLAPQEYMENGGSLRKLVAAKLYGQA